VWQRAANASSSLWSRTLASNAGPTKTVVGSGNRQRKRRPRLVPKKSSPSLGWFTDGVNDYPAGAFLHAPANSWHPPQGVSSSSSIPKADANEFLQLLSADAVRIEILMWEPPHQRKRTATLRPFSGGAAGNRTQRRNSADLRNCWTGRPETTRKYAKRPADTQRVLMASTLVHDE
jgi:hypothetical protein